MEYENDLHRSDTMEEKLSLVNRFGVQISYSKPSKKEFNEIVIELARRVGLTMTDEELCAEANKWEMRHGGISGRTAQQFINYLQGTVEIYERCIGLRTAHCPLAVKISWSILILRSRVGNALPLPVRTVPENNVFAADCRAVSERDDRRQGEGIYLARNVTIGMPETADL